MKEKLVVLLLTTIAITSVILLIGNLSRFSFKFPSTESLLDSAIKLVPMDASPLIASPSPSPLPSPSPSPSPPKPSSQAQRPCYRYSVPNSSPKCYTLADFDQLTSLGYQYSSAKSFYQFHLDGAARYQQEYEQTGSSIYLDAKASQETKANEQKQTLESILLQMQTIASRGW